MLFYTQVTQIEVFCFVFFLSFYNAAAAAKSLQSCVTLCNPIDGGPLSLGFSRQEHWSGLPFNSTIKIK